MKQFIKVLKEIKFRVRSPFRHSIDQYAIAVLVVYAIAILGCSYYKVKTLEPLSTQALADEVKNKKKYIILHLGDSVWHFKNVMVNETSHEITGTTEELPANHFYYKTARKNQRPNKYKHDSRDRSNSPIYEIHLYSTQPFTYDRELVTIPFSSINMVEVYDTHGGATFGSALGVTAGVAVVVGAILLATKSSCPFAYIKRGNYYDFAGEIYAGAINSALERDDYMPLPGLKPVDGFYELRITNELLETQYTNLAELLLINHPHDTRVLVDKNGAIQSISVPEAPEHAFSNTFTDHQSKLSAVDSIAYLFDDESSEGDEQSALILAFKKPVAVKSGKLVINARNSYWLDYVYGKFNEQFGSYYSTFAKWQKKVPTSRHIQWSLDQSIPLSVFIETQDGWKFLDYFNVVGPLASRDMVMPIDLSAATGDTVRLKVQTGFMFWELDYAALDFSENVDVQVTRLRARTAMDERGEDVSAMLSATDNHYLIQSEIGNSVNLQYTGSGSKKTQTAFLHSRGYYEYIREYQTWPDINALKSFRKKGEFTRFSKKKYDEFAGTDDMLASLLTQSHDN